MLATGVPHKAWFVGGTIKEAGATPKVHCIIAPIVTSFGISNLFVSGFQGLTMNRCLNRAKTWNRLHALAFHFLSQLSELPETIRLFDELPKLAQCPRPM